MDDFNKNDYDSSGHQEYLMFNGISTLDGYLMSNSIPTDI